MPLLLLLFLLLALCGNRMAWASGLPDPCQVSSLQLLPGAQFLLDPTHSLGAEAVANLPDERFQRIEGNRFPLEFSTAAIWLRFTLQADSACLRWLKVGEPRLDSVQVFVGRAGQWSEMHAGSDYPLSQWRVAARQPLFPLALAGGEPTQLLMRVQSSSALMIKPALWDEFQQQRALEWSNLLDGVSLGITLIIVPFGFVIGLIRRSQLLIMNALAIMAYGLVCCVVNGYLFYVPQWMPLKEQLISVLSCLAFSLFLGYMRVLFGVQVLPGWMKALLNLYTLLIGGLLLWGAFGDYRYTRVVFSELRGLNYLLIPLTLGATWLYGRRPSWLGLGLTALFVFQGTLRHFMDVKNVGWQYGEDQLGLTSTLPGVLLLVCTLVMEFSRSRWRERRALADLEEQRRAEHERLEGSVARRTEQLRESLRARSMLLARISHDLRTPLSSIIDYSRALEREGRTDLPQRIERNARRQLEMIDELLEFSRSDLQQLELVLAPGYLYGFLREIEDEGRFLSLRQDNRFACEFASDLPPLVQADFRRLRQVLINLLANAGKFTRDGLIEFAVERLDAGESGVTLRFSVRDSGIGIRADEREKLLQPFQRGSNAAAYDGSGLGLSIVCQLLQQMGSELNVDAQRERGAALGFVLRMACATEDEVESVVSDTGTVDIDGDGRCVLVVDDIQQNREGLYDLLAGYGFDVLTAADGGQALALLQTSTVDLLITDQMMAPMDGWALLCQVREHYPELPVLLYSAAPPLRPRWVPAGLAFDAALLKPAASGQVLGSVRRLLGSCVVE